MAKKRVTLPKSFKEILATCTVEEQKAVFEKCEINAYGGYGKGNALHFKPLSNELAVWLVENGADVNFPNTYGNTPLHAQVGWQGNMQILLTLGADIEAKNIAGETPLHIAAGKCSVADVKLLIENGANLNAKNLHDLTPIESMLARCVNGDLEEAAKVADLLLEAGCDFPTNAKKEMKRIGESYEFYKDGFAEEFKESTKNAIEHLYKLFSAEPVPEIKRHDGVSPITVKGTTWTEQYNELWDYLVPPSGYGKTVQAEVIRIAGKVSYEILDNGAMNWDGEFSKMLSAFSNYLSMGKSFGMIERMKINSVIKAVNSKKDEDSAEKLCEYAVRWIVANPNPIPLGNVDYKR